MKNQDRFALALSDGRTTEAVDMVVNGVVAIDFAKITLASWAMPIRAQKARFAAKIAVLLSDRRLVTAEWAWGLVSAANCAVAALDLHQSHPNQGLLREIIITSGDGASAMAWKRHHPDDVDEMTLFLLVRTSGDAETAVKMALSDPPMISVNAALDVLRHNPHGPSVVRLMQAKKINGALARRLVSQVLDAEAAEGLYDLGVGSAKWVNSIRVVVGLKPVEFPD